jgi:hypothetical protein
MTPVGAEKVTDSDDEYDASRGSRRALPYVGKAHGGNAGAMRYYTAAGEPPGRWAEGRRRPRAVRDGGRHGDGPALHISRDGDPQLHVHIAIANLVQRADGGRQQVPAAGYAGAA